jgi:hypothetical protein
MAMFCRPRGISVKAFALGETKASKLRAKSFTEAVAALDE